MEALLNVLATLGLLGAIALLLWGMVLCAIVGLGEGRARHAVGDVDLESATDLRVIEEPVAGESHAATIIRLGFSARE